MRRRGEAFLKCSCVTCKGRLPKRLALFERLKAAGAFVNEPVIGVAEAEKALRGLAAIEKKVIGDIS